MKPSRSSLLKAIGMPIAFFTKKSIHRSKIFYKNHYFSQILEYFSQCQYIYYSCKNKSTNNNIKKNQNYEPRN